MRRDCHSHSRINGTSSVHLLSVLAFLRTYNYYLVGAVGTTIACSIIPEFAKFQQFRSIVLVWLLGATVCDIVITIALVWHLVRSSSIFFSVPHLIHSQ